MLERYKQNRQKMDDDLTSGSDYSSFLDLYNSIRNPATPQAYTPSNAAPAPVTSTPLSKFVTPSTPTLADTFASTPKLNTVGRTPVQSAPTQNDVRQAYSPLLINPQGAALNNFIAQNNAKQAADEAARQAQYAQNRARVYGAPAPMNQPVVQQSPLMSSVQSNQNPLMPYNQTSIQKPAAEQRYAVPMSAPSVNINTFTRTGLNDYLTNAQAVNRISGQKGFGGGQGVSLSELQAAGQNTQLLPGRYDQLQEIAKTRPLTKSEQAEYNDYFQREQNAAITQRDAAEFKQRAKDNPVLGTIDAVMNPVLSGLGLVETVGQNVKNFFTGRNDPVDTNSPLFTWANRAQAASEGLTEDIQNPVGKFAAQTALSIGQTVISASLGGPEGALIIMSTGAAAQTAKDITDRGGSAAQAMWGGAAAGLAEYATEKLPLENLFKILDAEGKIGLKQAVGNFFKQGGIEASEEIVSQYANTISDIAIMGGNSEFSQYEKQYGTKAAMTKFFGIDPLLAGAGGFASGAVMAGGASAINIDWSGQANTNLNESVTPVKGSANTQTPIQNNNILQPVESSISANDQTFTNINFDATVNDNARAFNPTVAEMADKLGVHVEFDPTMGKPINGKFDGETNTIYLNPNADQPEIEIFKHELTHYLEKSDLYDNFKSFVFNSPEFAKYLQDKRTTVDDYRDDIADVYRASGQTLNSTDEIDREIAANFAKNLFTSQVQVNRLANTNPNLFQRVWNWVKDTAYKFANRNDSTAVFIRNAEKMYADAWANLQRQGGTQTVTGTAQYMPMYNHPAKTIGEFYDFVLNNRNNPQELNASQKKYITKDGFPVELFFDRAVKISDDHNLKSNEVEDIFAGLNNIRSAYLEPGTGAYNSRKVKISVETPNGKDAGIFLEFMKNGRVTVRTMFYDNKAKIENWQKQYDSAVLSAGISDVSDSSPAASPDGNRITVSSIAQNLRNVNRNLSENQEKFSISRTVLNSLNPTGGLYADYDPESRATAPLGENMTTYDKTAGLDPDEPVTIYRGADRQYGQKQIVAGDFITTNLDLAKSYAGDGNVLRKTVRARDILDDITEPLGEEYIYRPSSEKFAISEKPLQARRDLMRTLRNNYGVEKMSAAERDTFKSAVDIATEENNINNPEVRAELLRMLVESGTAENPNYTPELEQARTDIRNTRLYISPDTRAELTAMHGGDYAVFSRDAFANKLKPSQTRDGATNIDTFYEELQNTYGKSTFPDANHQAEMLQNMLDFVKGNQKQIPFTDMVAIRAKEYGVTTDELIQGYDNQLERELEKYGVKAQGEVNMRKRVNEIKAAWAEDVAAQRKEVRDRIRAAAQRRSIDNNIMKTLNELDSMKKKANPADREMLNELVSQFDTKAKSGLSDKSKLDVDAWIKKFDKSSDNTIDTPDAIQEKIDRFDKKNVADLNVQEASDLLAVAKFLKAQVRKNHTLFEGNKEIDAYKKGEQAIEQIKQSRNVIVGDKTGFATLSPKNFFRRISGNNPDSVFSQAYNDLNKGQLKTWEFKRDNLKPVTDFMENNKKLWQSWQGKDAEFIDTGIKRDDMPGKSPTLKITPMQRISLYMHSKNQDNMRHILNGGIVTPDAKLYKDGKLKEAYEKGTQFMLTKADVKSIINGMSAEEKFFADKLLHPYFNVDSKKAINSTSMLLDGYEKADVNNYFPITTDKDYVNRDFSGLVKDGTLEGMGLLKKRTNSANPITLEDASDVFLNSLDNVSKYYGLAVPIRNISTLLNVKMQGWQGSVSKELTNKFGGQALKYIENILGDLQFARTERSLLDKAISGYAKSSISGNVGSALQQPTALFNALPELGIHTLNPLNFRPVKSETMEKYSSLYWFRKQGNTTPEIAEITRNQKWDKHVPFFMKMTEITDDWNMKRIWNGAELYVRATDKSLKPRSEEFYKAVGAKFDEVLLNTQSNNTTLQKAAIMRSHNPLVNAVTLFQNQMYVTYNQMLTAAGDVEYAFKTGKGKKAAVNKMALTSAGVILSSLTAALALGLYKGLQGNEPDDLKAATVRNIIGYLPFGQIGFDFVNSLVTDTKWDKDFNGLQVANVGMLNTFGTDLQALADIYSKVTGQGGWNWREGKKQLLGPTKKAALDLSRFFGVPAANFEKLITGAVGGSLDFAVEKNILPERFAGFREGEQNFFSEFSKSDLTYASQNKTPFAFRNEFNIVLDNSLNKGSFLNKNTFSIDAKNEIYRLYNTSGKSDVVPNPNVTKVGDVDLTLQQQIDYGQRYAETIQKPLENLLKSALYKSFSDDDKLKAVKALYSYANGVAGKSVSPEYEQAAWVANVESISKTVPVETAIALRNEFNRDGSDGKALYNTTQKRKMLFDNKSLTPVQKQAFDAKLLGGDKKDEKTGVITYGGADYTNTGNFALSLLPEAKIKNYTDYKLSGIITKEQYASAYNALAATGKELEDNDEKWALTDWSVRNKDGTYGATITNSASLLKREALEKALAGIPVTQVRGRNYRADIYLAFGIGKTVAEMSQAEFIRELKAVNRTYTNNLKYKENAELKNKIKKAG